MTFFSASMTAFSPESLSPHSSNLDSGRLMNPANEQKKQRGRGTYIAHADDNIMSDKRGRCIYLSNEYEGWCHVCGSFGGFLLKQTKGCACVYINDASKRWRHICVLFRKICFW